MFGIRSGRPLTDHAEGEDIVYSTWAHVAAKAHQEVAFLMEYKGTTAGQKSSFAYQKLISVLVKMITEPRSAFILGGTYKILVLLGHYDKTFVQDQKKDETFNEAAFGREYESRWSGTVEDAFFNGDAFDRSRCLETAEAEYSGRSSVQSYYVVSVDVGRRGCDSVATVIKVVPQAMGESYKSLVNIQTFSDEHFED